MKICGWIWIGMLKFCTTAYVPNGTPPGEENYIRPVSDGTAELGDIQIAQRNIMLPGNPSVRFVRQLVHILLCEMRVWAHVRFEIGLLWKELWECQQSGLGVVMVLLTCTHHSLGVAKPG